MANVIRLKRASGSDPAASDLVSGEPAVRTDTGELFFKKDDGSIAKVAGAGGGPDFKYLALRNAANNGAASFPNADFTLVRSGTTSALTPTAANTLLVSVNGVIQKPNTGTSTPSQGFALSGSTIKFGANISAAPDFILYQESGGIGEPSDDTVSEVKLKVSNSPINGYFLSAQSGNNGGLTWAAPVATSCTGNSATATALATARTINGTSFDGTANITVTAAAGTLTGNTLNSSVTASSLTSLGDLSGLTVTGNMAVDTSTLFVNASTDRVGIGTSSPQRAFHQHEDSSAANYHLFTNTGTGSNANDGGIVGIDASENLILWNQESTNLRFATNDTERMRIDSSGRVGINQTSFATSDTMLSISELTGHLEVGLLSKNDSACVINFGDPEDYNIGRIKYANDDNSMRFDANDAERIRITSSGKVGIGTTSPAEELVVRADAPSIQLESSNASGRNYGLQANNDGKFHAYDGTAGANRVTLDSSGNVGIGTTSPSNMLHLSGTDPIIQFTDTVGGDSFGLFASHTDYLGFYNFTDSRVDMAIDGSGNVGIGTTSPTASLHVSGSSPQIRVTGSGSGSNNSSNILFQNSDTGSGGSDGFFVGLGGTEIAYLYNYENTPLAFATNDTERMRINSNGAVMINTTNSSSRTLNLKGTFGILSTAQNSVIDMGINDSGQASISPFRSDGSTLELKTNASGSGVSTKLFIGSSGDVGIGTTSPTGKFHIKSTSATTSDLDMLVLDGGSTGFNGSNDASTIYGIQFKGCSFATGGFGIQQRIGAQILFGKNTTWNAAAGGGGECKTDIIFTTSSGTFTSSPSSLAQTERMRISHDGGLFLGITSAPNSSSGGACFRINDAGRRELLMATTTTNTRALVEFINGNGSVGSISVSGSNTSYNTSSDYRLKENVTAISDGIARLKTLKPSRFNFKADSSTIVDGFLAHEVTAVPEAITGTKDEVATEDTVSHKKGDPIYQSIDQSKLVPLLVAALQEAIGRIEALEAK